VQLHWHPGRKWRRFARKYRLQIVLAWVVFLVLALVGLLMYTLTSPAWRSRW
jgi:hypothetical protein